jgi:hypothetical protein
MKNYDKLRELLNEDKQWPRLYMYKFIIPNQDDKVEQVASKMQANCQISYKHTNNLKFVSLTCKVTMHSADSIVDVLISVAEISGVMVL